MPERPTGPPDLEELVALARRFADRKRFDEAIELFQLALRLEPQDLGKLTPGTHASSARSLSALWIEYQSTVLTS